MPKTKWEGAEVPTINNFFKIERIQSQNLISTEVARNSPWRKVSSIWDPYGPPADTCQVEKIN